MGFVVKPKNLPGPDVLLLFKCNQNLIFRQNNTARILLTWTLADKSRLALRTSFIRGAIFPEDIMDPDTGADGGTPRGTE